ncbi:ubiquitin-specific protease [Sarracenia purpurea var. burkii]
MALMEYEWLCHDWRSRPWRWLVVVVVVARATTSEGGNDGGSSGKCQIIHWRQGHKEECRPFTTYQSNDAGGGYFQKVLKQEDSEIHGISFESEGRQRAKSVKNFLKEPASSKSGSTPEVFHGNDGTEVEFPADGKDKNVSLHEAERSDGDQPTNIFPDKPMTSSVKNVNQNGPPSSKRTILVDSIDCLTSSGKLNEVKPDYADHNSQCGSTSSSGWSADGSNESSFSEPSTPSSGFWEGNINSSKLKMDALDDCAQSSSGGAGDADLRNSQSSLSCSFKPHGNVIPPLVEQDSGAKTITSDEHCSTTLGIKKPMDRAVLSQEKSADASKGRSSPLVSPKNSDYIDVCMSSDSPVSKSGEPRFYSSGTYVSGRPSISTRASKASSMHSLGPEKSNHLVDDTRSISSSDFIAHPSSSTRRQSLQGENPGKVENAHAIASETANYSPNTKNGLTTSMRKVVDQFRTSKSSRHYQSEVGSEISGRYNNKGLFPYELFVTLYNWNKVELRPFGLTNCGNR